MASWPEGEGVVELPDGSRVRGRGLRHPAPAGPDPEFGLYLLGERPDVGPWPSRWVRWPDFRLPSDRADAIGAFREVVERAPHERVEVACGGGRGRTGTALAVIAAMSGIPQREAVRWVRARYHPRAVETPWQARWVRTVDLEAAR
jgi:hypothetical protein